MRISLLYTLGLLSVVAACNFSRERNEADSKKERDIAWTQVPRVTTNHLRGLDATSDNTIWASGTNGEVLRSIDLGNTWTSHRVPNCEGIDFRDVEGFDKNRAVVMSSGNGVRLYYTLDGGSTWQLSYEDTNSKVFFDGIDFNGSHGIAYGDPIAGRMTMLASEDSGKSWIAVDTNIVPNMLEGEAGFAASGTGIVVSESITWIATGGGERARVFVLKDHEWIAKPTPLNSAPSAGIFSMAFFNELSGIVVGGDYVDSTNAEANAAYTADGGKSWQTPKTTPNGYRSCVALSTDGKTAVATGRSGTDMSEDRGKSWHQVSSQGFFSCVIIDDKLIGVGRNGSMGVAALSSVSQ